MLHAFEGPAGSGKSYQLAKCRKELTDSDTVFIQRPSLPRNLGPAIGAWSSSYLEYMAISAAVMMPEKTFYVDRFLLSRWVYKAIEDGGNVTKDLERSVTQSWFDFCEVATSEADRRIGYGRWDWPQVSIYVLLPSLEALVERRVLAMVTEDRTYPFSPLQELSLYREVAGRISALKLSGVDIELLEPALIGV